MSFEMTAPPPFGIDGPTRPLCAFVMTGDCRPADGGYCICRWHFDDDGCWWVRVDSHGTAYTVYERYAESPF